jgi:hypothetical protein
MTESPMSGAASSGPKAWLGDWVRDSLDPHSENEVMAALGEARSAGGVEKRFDVASYSQTRAKMRRRASIEYGPQAGRSAAVREEIDRAAGAIAVVARVDLLVRDDEG